MNRGFILAPGTLADIATIEAIPEVRTWTRQADQRSIIPWAVSATPPRYPTYLPSLAYTSTPQGLFTWTWRLSVVTFGMWAYLTDIFFDDDPYQREATVSGRTYTFANTAFYFQAVMARPVDVDPAQFARGFRDVTLSFSAGVEVTA